MTGVVTMHPWRSPGASPDERSEYADSVLVALDGKTLLVPCVWSQQIANAVLVGERQRRLGSPEILRFTTLLENLPVLEDTQSVGDLVGNVLPLAPQYSLSAYDAAYLELSIRRGAPLAT